MNFAMWGKLFDEDAVHYSVAQRLAKRAVDVLNPFFQIKSLYDFNAKFSPVWISRMLVFQEPTDLPRVGLLYAGAEGFLAIPGVGELFVPRAVGGASRGHPRRPDHAAMSDARFESISLVSGADADRHHRARPGLPPAVVAVARRHLETSAAPRHTDHGRRRSGSPRSWSTAWR